MFDIPNSQSGLHRFFESNAEGLQNAALLLGGKPKLRQVQTLLDDLSSGTTITRRITANIVALHDLLTLQHVADDDRPEAGYFADLDPAAPYVDEICLLADELGAAIENHLKPSRPLANFFESKVTSEGYA